MPASPHRVGHHPGLHGEDMPYTTGDQPKRRNAHASDVGMNRPTRSRYEALTLDELLESDDNEYEPPRLPTSSIRLQPGEYVQGRTKMHVHQGPPPVQKRQSQKREEQTARDQAKAEGRQEQAKHHSLVIFVLSMLATLVLLVLGGFAVGFVHAKSDDFTYGNPRTFQCDAVVGHADSKANPSHFIALNLRRQVEIIELPGSDPSKARVYVVLTLVGDDQEKTSVTLSFKDVTGSGKLDMLVHIEGQTIVYINANGSFRLQRPGERVSL